MLKRLFGKEKGSANQKDSPHGPLLPPAQILKSDDPLVRSAAAAHPDALPEVLYVLAADPDVTVRRNVAGNPGTPSVVSPALACDVDVDVRSVLLSRLVKLLPDLSPDQHSELYTLTVKALETLARDQVRFVREALANTLKDVAYAPVSVVRTLAQDIEQTVAEPVLQLCASLTDDDLLDIISRQPAPWALAAISGRRVVSAGVANAIIDTGDVRAGSILLDNTGAVLEDGTLEHMVEKAPDVPEWQAPLANRPNLPKRLAIRLAEFVDRTVMAILEKRRDFDAQTRREIVSVTRRRLDYLEQAGTNLSAEERAAILFGKKRLTEDTVMDAISWNDRAFVVASLALMTHVPLNVIETILDARNGKVITALAWKAGLSMRAALQLQTRVASLNGREVVNARGGDAFPLSEEDMIWQLECAGVVT